jgi:hypothetical protein
MEPNDTSKESSFDIAALVAGLTEMRDSLMLLSTLIKDYKATLDWDVHGEGLLKAMEATSQAARGTQWSGTRPERSD